MYMYVSLGMYCFVSNAVNHIIRIIVIGSDGNADEGSDTDGFVVTTESVTNDEGHVSILVNWKVRLSFCIEFAEPLH